MSGIVPEMTAHCLEFEPSTPLAHSARHPVRPMHTVCPDPRCQRGICADQEDEFAFPAEFQKAARNVFPVRRAIMAVNDPPSGRQPGHNPLRIRCAYRIGQEKGWR